MVWVPVLLSTLCSSLKSGDVDLVVGRAEGIVVTSGFQWCLVGSGADPRPGVCCIDDGAVPPRASIAARRKSYFDSSITGGTRMILTLLQREAFPI